MRLPAIDRVELPCEREALVARVEELIAQGRGDGYVRTTHDDGELFLFLHRGSTYSGGELLGERFIARGVSETLGRWRPATRAELCVTDLPLFLCTAVLFRKAPAARIPSSLVDPAMILDSMRRAGKDSVLVICRGDARSLAFCRDGEPEVLYIARGEEFPSDGSIADRIVEYVFASGNGRDTWLDIYEQIHLPPAPDAGQPFETGTSAEAPTRRVLSFLVTLGGRPVFYYPITRPSVLVGRGAGMDLQLDNLSVSRSHAEARLEGERVTIRDLGGTNGLVVGGERVDEAVLSPGDRVDVGEYTVELSDADIGAVPLAPAPRDEEWSAEPTYAMETRALLPDLEHDGKKYKLDVPSLEIGSAESADVRISGMFIAPVHARIVRRDLYDFEVFHIEGRRAVKVGNQPVARALLTVGDQFSIGPHRFRIVTGD